MNPKCFRVIFAVLAIGLLLILLGCNSADSEPTLTATATNPVTQTLPSAEIATRAATNLAPTATTAVAQATSTPTSDDDITFSTFTAYRDDLVGITLQRPIEWTPRFPVRNEITSLPDQSVLQANPKQSYALFRYESVGTLEENSSPDMPSLLLAYLQQNVASDLTIDAVEATTLGQLPAARWQEETASAENVLLEAQEWLIYADPLIYRISTTAQVAPDGIDNRPILQQMLSSVAFEQPSLLRGVLQYGRYQPYLQDYAFYSSAKHGIAFNHPPTAIVDDAAERLIVASDSYLLDGFDQDEIGYLVLYQELAEPWSEPTIDLAADLINLPDTTSRQVDQNSVLLDRYSATAIMNRNRPDNRFTYEVAVYLIDKGDSQAAIVSVKYGTAAPVVWTETVIGSLIFGP